MELNEIVIEFAEIYNVWLCGIQKKKLYSSNYMATSIYLKSSVYLYHNQKTQETSINAVAIPSMYPTNPICFASIFWLSLGPVLSWLLPKSLLLPATVIFNYARSLDMINEIVKDKEQRMPPQIHPVYFRCLPSVVLFIPSNSKLFNNLH